MASVFTKVVANFTTTLASAISLGGLTASLAGNTTKDGATLPNGRYCFTVNQGRANEQHFVCNVTGTSITGIEAVDRLGNLTPGAAKAANINDEIKITDFVNLKWLVDDVDALNTLIAGIIISGSPDASTTVRGVSMLTAVPDTVIGDVTMTIASPAVATKVAHGLIAGDSIKFSTTGALPTGVTPGATYYVIGTGLTADNFQFSATFGGAAVNTSGSQSGVHTLTRTTPRAVGENDVRLPNTNETAFLNAITGMISMYASATPPSGFLLCDGSGYSFTDYADLFAVTGISYGLAGTVAAVANAGTDQIEITAHGYSNGQRLYITATSLPGGLSAATPYYVVNAVANAFQLSATVGGAAIDITSTGTAVFVNSQFRVPDLRGSVPVGRGQKAAETFTFLDANVNVGTDEITIPTNKRLYTGQAVALTTNGVLPTGLSATTYYIIRISATVVKLATTLANANYGTAVNITAAAGGGTHTLTYSNFSNFAVGDQGGSETDTTVPAHYHSVNDAAASGDGGSSSDLENPGLTGTTGESAPNNMQPYTVVNYIIKT